MRQFRVFNDVHHVRIIWKLAGVRLGAFGQIAILSLAALAVFLVNFVSVIVAIVVFVIGFLAVTVYATILTRLDETEKVSERTQLVLLFRGLKHRRTTNFDLPDL